MADYPTDHAPITDALMAWAPPAAVAEAIYAAQAIGSPPVREVATFDALKAHVATLDLDGLRLLCGCAHICARFNFHGRADEALPVLLVAHARLNAMDPGESPQDLGNP